MVSIKLDDAEGVEFEAPKASLSIETAEGVEGMGNWVSPSPAN